MIFRGIEADAVRGGARVISSAIKTLAPVLPAMIAVIFIMSGPVWGRGALEPVKKFGGKVEVDLSPEEETAMESLVETAKGYGGDPLQMDPRLVLACRELAGEIQGDLSRRSEILSSDHFSGTLMQLGIYETSTSSRSYTYGTASDIQALISLHFSSERHVYTHMGAGVAPPNGQGAIGVVVFILSDVRADISPFPRAVTMPSSWTLKGRLVYSTRGLKPNVLLTPPRGQVQPLPVKSSGNLFSVSVPFNQGPGIYRLEVVAAGNGKSKNSALLEIKAGLSESANSATFKISGFDSKPEDEAQAEAMMIKMINQVRDKEGLGLLDVDYSLTEMAKSHSRDMKKNKYGIEHLSPEFGSISDRSLTAGLGDYQVRENLALNSNLVQAMNNLLQSPVHRAAILDPLVTHIGVGIAFDYESGTRHYYVVQEFVEY